MSNLIGELKAVWLRMLEPPWSRSELDDSTAMRHWELWLLGWLWALAGLAGGAVVAPWFVQRAGLAGTSFQDASVLGIAVLAGFLVQMLGWLLLKVANVATPLKERANAFPEFVSGAGVNRVPKTVWQRVADGFSARLVHEQYALITLMPIFGVYAGVMYYFQLVGPVQRDVTIAFVGGLLIKSFLVPAVWGALRSKSFKIIMNWLRGDKDTKTA